MVDFEEIYYKFVDEYLHKTNHMYSLLYLYVLRFAAERLRIPTIPEQAERLQLIPDDVSSAWLFWVQQGLARIDGDSVELTMIVAAEQNDEPIMPRAIIPGEMMFETTMFDEPMSDESGFEASTSGVSTSGAAASEVSTSGAAASEVSTSGASTSGVSTSGVAVSGVSTSGVSMTPSMKGEATAHGTKAEAMLLEEPDSEFSWFAGEVTAAFGGQIPPKDMDTLKFLYSEVGLDVLVLNMLIQYARETNKSMSVIEKMAISWKEKGIDTIEKAERVVKNTREGARLAREREVRRDKSKGINNFEARELGNREEIEMARMEELFEKARKGGVDV